MPCEKHVALKAILILISQELCSNLLQFGFPPSRPGGISSAWILPTFPGPLSHHEAVALLLACLRRHPRHLLRLRWRHLQDPVQGRRHRRSGSWRKTTNDEKERKIRSHSPQKERKKERKKERILFFPGFDPVDSNISDPLPVPPAWSGNNINFLATGPKWKSWKSQSRADHRPRHLSFPA